MPSSNEIDDLKRRMYEYIDPATGQRVAGLKKPGVTISRLRRCQNCLHFDIDEGAQKVFRHCIARDRRTLRQKGCSEEGIREHVTSLERGIRDQFGVVGVCSVKDKRTDEDRHGDFTAFQFQCDQWSGRIVLDAAEAAADPTAAEVYANLKKV